MPATPTLFGRYAHRDGDRTYESCALQNATLTATVGLMSNQQDVAADTFPLFFLLMYILSRPRLMPDWIFAFNREKTCLVVGS